MEPDLPDVDFPSDTALRMTYMIEQDNAKKLTALKAMFILHEQELILLWGSIAAILVVVAVYHHGLEKQIKELKRGS